MTAFALSLLLAAGFVHAGWNYLAKPAGACLPLSPSCWGWLRWRWGEILFETGEDSMPADPAGSLIQV